MVIGAYTISKDETGTSFLGYLVNTGKVACEGIQVAVTLQDAGGRAIATQTSYDVRDIVLPGERSPFAVNFDNGVVWAKEELHVVAQVLDPGGLWHRAKGLSLTDIVATPANPAQKRSYYISGLVRNAGSAPAVLVEIFGIAYDTAGRPIDVNSAKVFALQINPGQTSRFALEFPRVKTEPAHYDLYVQGHIPH